VLTIVGYSQFWIPALFARTWGWSIPEVGLYFGLVVLICGPVGTNLGGWFGDYLFARGYRDAMVRALLGCIAISVPCFMIAPLMPSGALALLVFAPATIASAAASTTGNAALMIVTPNEMRAQISAVSLLVISIVGLIVGPTSVAMFTDFVFKDESALRYSMAIVPSGFGLLSFIVLLKGRCHYEAAVDPHSE
jgi:MFS family permease